MAEAGIGVKIASRRGSNGRMAAGSPVAGSHPGAMVGAGESRLPKPARAVQLNDRFPEHLLLTE